VIFVCIVVITRRCILRRNQQIYITVFGTSHLVVNCHLLFPSEIEVYEQCETFLLLCLMCDKVATLLRLATLEDHIFLLSHVLRCPAGIAKWAGSYVQPVLPVHSCRDLSTGFGSVLLDHFVTMLAMVLQPVRLLVVLFRIELITHCKLMHIRVLASESRRKRSDAPSLFGSLSS